MERVVPAADAVARQQAEAAFAGLYVSADAPATGALRLVVDPVGPGLRVSEFRLHGEDLTQNASTFLSGRPPANATTRLYPSGLVSRSSNGSSTAARVSFRAIAAPEPQRDAPSSASPDYACGGSWGGLDNPLYAGKGLDEFVFSIGADGYATKVEAPGWRLELHKVPSAHR